MAAWIESSGLLINVLKTQLMVLVRKGKRHNTDKVNVKIIGDTTLPKRDQVTYLGVKLDNDLSWKIHISRVFTDKFCMAKLAVIRRSSCHLPQKVRALLYQAFVPPHTDYCSVVWNDCGAILRQRVERIQNYALRMILLKPLLSRTEPMRASLGWPTPETRRQNTKCCLCLVHRCRLGQAPSFLCSKFQTNSQTGFRNVINKSMIV